MFCFDYFANGCGRFSDLIGITFSLFFFFFFVSSFDLSFSLSCFLSIPPDHECSALYYHTILLLLTLSFLPPYPIPSQEKKKGEGDVCPVLINFTNTLHGFHCLRE